MHIPAHFYIHWPFCKNKCHYCDFVAFEKHEEFIENYHYALCEEITRFAHATQKSNRTPIKTIFFGGGTPSLYPLPLLKELFSILHRFFDLSALEEVSLEVNPGGLHTEHFETWKALGINRLSVGVQVLNDAVLASLNRFQTIEDVTYLMHTAPYYIPNISADFIMGLPGICEQEWYDGLTSACSWPLTHISIYLLTIHEKTPLYFKVKKGTAKLPSEHILTACYKNTIAFLESKGLMHYEISNFARPGYESIHNQAYWERKPYQGFGLGASSFDGERRTTNIKNLTRYLETYQSRQEMSRELIYHSSEHLSKEQVHIERLMLGLRQKKGLDLHAVLYSDYKEQNDALRTQINLLKSLDLLDEKNEKIYLTDQGMLIENEIVAMLI